jgi:hypothetical protein
LHVASFVIGGSNGLHDAQQEDEYRQGKQAGNQTPGQLPVVE